MSRLVRLLRDRRAASAAEFALVLPLLMILLFGIIDMGRFFFMLNRSEKATQMGARMAIVTTPVSTDLVEASFIGGGVDSGDLIPASALGTIRCTSTACTCETAPCPTGFSGDVDADAFGVIATRMAQMNPMIGPENIEIRYSGSGFGYAGPADDTMDIQPLVTVSLQNIPFAFLALLGIGQITMPEARATLTAEDSSGAFSN